MRTITSRLSECQPPTSPPFFQSARLFALLAWRSLPFSVGALCPSRLGLFALLGWRSSPFSLSALCPSRSVLFALLARCSLPFSLGALCPSRLALFALLAWRSSPFSLGALCRSRSALSTQLLPHHASGRIVRPTVVRNQRIAPTPHPYHRPPTMLREGTTIDRGE